MAEERIRGQLKVGDTDNSYQTICYSIFRPTYYLFRCIYSCQCMLLFYYCVLSCFHSKLTMLAVLKARSFLTQTQLYMSDCLPHFPWIWPVFLLFFKKNSFRLFGVAYYSLLLNGDNRIICKWHKFVKCLSLLWICRRLSVTVEETSIWFRLNKLVKWSQNSNYLI